MTQYQVCNRFLADPAPNGATLCDCCRFNKTIPDMSVKGNREKWYRLEAAKRRLFYDLSQLGLPYGTAEDGIQPSLSFDFKADVIAANRFWRSLDQSERVFTGHAEGLITINIREADSVERERLRVVLGETRRTLIGHFRHEIGHFYWDVLIKNRREAEFKELFGDHEQPTYAEALDSYYKNGPAPDWSQRFIAAMRRCTLGRILPRPGGRFWRWSASSIPPTMSVSAARATRCTPMSTQWSRGTPHWESR